MKRFTACLGMIAALMVMGAVTAVTGAAAEYRQFFAVFENGPEAWTGLAVYNPGGEEAVFSVQVRDAEGAVRSQTMSFADPDTGLQTDMTSCTVQAGGQRSFQVGTDWTGSGWLILDCNGSVPPDSLMLLGGPRGMREVRPGAGSTSSVFPMAAWNEEWDSLLNLANTSGHPLTAVLTLIDPDGQELGVMNCDMAANGCVQLSLRTAFSLSGGAAGSLRIDAPGPVLATLVYDNFRSGGTASAGLNGLPEECEVKGGGGLTVAGPGLAYVLGDAGPGDLALVLPYGMKVVDGLGGVLFASTPEERNYVLPLDQDLVILQDVGGRESCLQIRQDEAAQFVEPSFAYKEYSTTRDTCVVYLEAMDPDPLQKISRIEVLEGSVMRGSIQGSGGWFPVQNLALGETRVCTARAVSVSQDGDEVGAVERLFKVRRKAPTPG